MFLQTNTKDKNNLMLENLELDQVSIKLSFTGNNCFISISYHYGCNKMC